MCKTRIVIAALLATLCVASAVGLSACVASSHQIITADKECLSCHEEKPTYEVSDPAGAIEVNTTFTVSASAVQVIVCKPKFISQDGSTCVPIQSSAVTVSGGKAEVTVAEGVWAIALDKGDSSTYKIVKASLSCSNKELSL